MADLLHPQILLTRHNFISEKTRASSLKDLNLFFNFLLKGIEMSFHFEAYEIQQQTDHT